MGESVRVVLQDANYTKPTMNIQLVSTSGDLRTSSCGASVTSITARFPPSLWGRDPLLTLALTIRPQRLYLRLLRRFRHGPAPPN